MKAENFKKALKEAAVWMQYATEFELSKMLGSEARAAVLNRIFDKYYDTESPDLLEICEKALIHLDVAGIEKGLQYDLKLAIQKATS